MPLNDLSSRTHTFFCSKKSRKQTGLQKSQLTLHSHNSDQIVSYELEHNPRKKYPHGGVSSKVKKGFLPGSAHPSFAVKVLNPYVFDYDRHHELRTAMRSVFCARLLGYSAHTFRSNDKQYVATEWLPGKPLSAVPSYQLSNISVGNRIVMAIELTQQISRLHKYGICHLDIKPENVMFDGKSLKIFDFDSVRLENEKISGSPDNIYTKNYLPPRFYFQVATKPKEAYKLFDKTTDLHTLIQTIAFLFPDVIMIQHVIKVLKFASRKHDFRYPGFQFTSGGYYYFNEELGKLLLRHIYLDKIFSLDELCEEMKAIIERNYPAIDLAKIHECENPISHQSGREAFDKIEKEIISYAPLAQDFAESLTAKLTF